MAVRRGSAPIRPGTAAPSARSAAPDSSPATAPTWFSAISPNDKPGEVRYAASKDGGPYRDVAGPPLSWLAATSISAVPGGGYLTRDSYGVYASDDGVTWRPIYSA
jgi:hypothetical protein